LLHVVSLAAFHFQHNFSWASAITQKGARSVGAHYIRWIPHQQYQQMTSRMICLYPIFIAQSGPIVNGKPFSIGRFHDLLPISSVASIFSLPSYDGHRIEHFQTMVHPHPDRFTG
jgi:hypothetical protein